jgi:hypothetical protein
LGTAVVAYPAATLVLLVALVLTFTQSWSLYFIDAFVEGAISAVVLIAIVGAATAVHQLLDAPPEMAASAGPRELLQHDRPSSLMGALASGLLVSASVLPGLVLGSAVGSLIVQAVSNWSGWPGELDIRAVVDDGRNDLTVQLLYTTSVVIGALVLLPGLMVSVLLLFTRAWPRFVVTRLILAVRGQLPLRLFEFLADARRRQLLRHSGDVYQFRHIRIQQWLVAPPQPTQPKTIRRRVTAAVISAACVASVALLLTAVPSDDSIARLAGSHHAGPYHAKFSGADNFVITASWNDSVVRVWDLKKNYELATRLPGHKGGVADERFSPDGSVLATYGGVSTDDRSDDVIKLCSMESP